jgi:hypothetical protein
VEVGRHRAPVLTLGDGSRVARGDRIGIFHLNNERVAELHGDGSETPVAALRSRRLFTVSLSELARQVREGDRYAGVVAFTTQTIFHQATQRLGFDILPFRSSTWSRLVALYQRSLVASFHPLGRRWRKRRRFDEARAIWISRSELLRRYAPDRSVPSGTDS